MLVDYSRNPNKFALPKYVQYVNSGKNVGLYTKMTIEMAGRLLTSDGAEFAWYDGQEQPSFEGNNESFVFTSYATKRKAFGYVLGELAAEQASWDILAQHGRIMAQRAMTSRTLAALTLLTTSGNYAAANTSAVSSITGVTGKWDVSTTARMDIKRSLDYAANQIALNTLSAVDPSDMILVMSPGCAQKLAVCQEIRDHIKQSPAAEKTVKGPGLGPLNDNYGLPETLYGYPVVVEKTVRVTSRKGATRAASYILSDATPFMVSRPGGLEGVEGSPSFSSCTVFFKEEMTVESKHDKDNRRHVARIVDDYDVVGTALDAAFLFTSAVS